MGSIDPAQLSRWFDAYASALVLYARQWLPDGAAEDIVQDVFIRLMSQRPAPANAKAWLFRSVRNAALSHLRSRHRAETREQRVAADRPAWFDERPEELISAAEAQAALGTLPDEQREVIVLRIWGQLTFEEIAEILGRSVSTLFSRYKTGLAAIRKKLELSCRAKTD
jgi:RNA polymerase sigma-70 factor (ECF subfamily)